MRKKDTEVDDADKALTLERPGPEVRVIDHVRGQKQDRDCNDAYHDPLMVHDIVTLDRGSSCQQQYRGDCVQHCIEGRQSFGRHELHSID